ncbi:helix-turn-helix domain-containing protein [Saccharopolyspora shandongensis]|uniref:PucR family transcriptional regulator n=1 Tax=Saccharopolyspora shandongensis TaxID=418495 RepID=UPI0033E1581E
MSPPASRALSAMTGDADPEIRSLVSETARRLNDQLPGLARDMSDLLAHRIDKLDSDGYLVQLLLASVDANIKTIVHVLTNHIPIEHLQPTTAAVEYALRLAQRDIPGNSLVRAYHMGQDYLIQRVYGEVRRLDCTADTRLLVLHHISRVVYQYIDWISLYVIDAYEEERKRWNNTRGSVQSSLVHKILSDDPVPAAAFEAETAYRLGQFHIAAIIWSPDSSTDQLRTLEERARTLAVRWNSCGPPIVTAIDRATVWAWIPRGRNAEAIDMADVRRFAEEAGGCRIALGLPGSGTGGFRRSHAQAQAARSVALASPDDRTPPAVGFGDQGVAIVSMLAKDIDETRQWVRDVLGQLAVANEHAATLRETMRIFFRTGENYARTAELMHLHRNTVKYRMNKVFGEGSTPTSYDRMDVALALEVCHFLGERVLHQPDHP